MKWKGKRASTQPRAKEIPEPRINNEIDKHITKNSSSMFIGAVNDKLHLIYTDI